jgi:hypothetical protein
MKLIQKIEWGCSEYDCYTNLIPVALSDVDEDMECVVPGGLLMEFRRILRDLVAQSNLSRKVSAYGPCTIDAQTLLSNLNDNKEITAHTQEPS